MIAAIYARKSTDQRNVAEEQKSVARQVELARAYAAREGWSVDEASIFVDDGISGAEFDKRPAFKRMLAMLKTRPTFQVLIVSEQKSLGRESFETGSVIKQFDEAGVDIVSYMDGRSLVPRSWMDKAMSGFRSAVDEAHIHDTSKRTTEAQTRLAQRGYVTGGRLFGYRNVDVCVGTDQHGRPQRSHVRREVVDAEAAVIRRIFELCASGSGLKVITKTLNAEHLPSPRSQRGRPNAWSPSSVREVLYRETYRGTVVWNKTKKRDRWGKKKPTARPETDWIRSAVDDMRIVSDALWNAAHARLAERRENHQRWTRGDVRTRPVARGAHQPYLLSGFARCGTCGGSMQAVSRDSTTGRLFRYVCGNYVNRGATVCANATAAAMGPTDDAVRELLAGEVLRPAVLERALEEAVTLLTDEEGATARQARRAAIEKGLRAAEAALANLTDTAARCGPVPAVLEGIASKDAERRALAAELEALTCEASTTAVALKPAALRKELRGYLANWTDIARANVVDARQLLETVLRSRIVFTPTAAADGSRNYELRIPIAFDRLLVMAAPSLGSAFARVSMASPPGFEPGFWP